MEKIDKFEGEYFFLSNYYEVPVEYGGLKFRNNEAAFQAQKCVSGAKRKEFQSLDPSKAKALGRSVKLREDWEDVKTTAMLGIVRNKFKQNKGLGKKLIETGDAYLEEGNWWGDRIWGVCKGVGENRLGKILMQVREELKNEDAYAPLIEFLENISAETIDKSNVLGKYFRNRQRDTRRREILYRRV